MKMKMISSRNRQRKSFIEENKERLIRDIGKHEKCVKKQQEEYQKEEELEQEEEEMKKVQKEEEKEKKHEGKERGKIEQVEKEEE